MRLSKLVKTLEFNETDARKAWIGFGSTSNNDLTIYQENTDSDVVIPRGNVGIGTSSPDGALHVRDNSRDYYVNKNIEGETESKAGANYILLHRSYCGNENCGTNYDGQTSSGINSINDNYVFGEISAIRGSWAAWNRKINAKVNTASAYNANRGSVISHMEGVSLVHVMYEETQYIALKINSGSGMWGITFTGWAYASEGELLKLVYDDDITEESPFESLEDIKIQGGVAINDDSYILGDVGIGTTSPTSDLHVKGSSPAISIENTYTNDDGTVTGRRWGLYSTGGNSSVGGEKFAIMDWSDHSSALDSDKARLVVDKNGNVGIGTTSPGAKLEINAQDSSEQVILRRTKVSTQDEGHYSFGADGGGLKFWSGGYANSGGSAEVLFDPNGNITANSVFYESDSRYKKEIQTLPSALENILSLRGVSYYWKDRSDNTEQIGVIAQEVEKIYPQLVHTNEDGYKSVAYANLVSPLIEAVKELHALYQGHADRLVALEAQNAEQDNHIAHQDERIAHQDELIVQLEVRLAALEAAQ